MSDSNSGNAGEGSFHAQLQRKLGELNKEGGSQEDAKENNSDADDQFDDRVLGANS